MRQEFLGSFRQAKSRLKKCILAICYEPLYFLPLECLCFWKVLSSYSNLWDIVSGYRLKVQFFMEHHVYFRCFVGNSVLFLCFTEICVNLRVFMDSCTEFCK
jgi:hypothetical protein